MGGTEGRLARALAGMTLIACAAAALAAQVDVGGQSISIPPPDTFAQATTQRMIKMGELSTIKEDRLLAVFGEKTGVAQEAKGGPFVMDRYAFAQATRNVEPYQIPLDRFAKYKEDTKAQDLAGLTADERAEVRKNLERTSKWLESDTGVKSNIGVPRVGTDAVIAETPTSLTTITKISIPMQVGAGQQKTVDQIVGMSQVLVKSKVIWLQLYARSNTPDDFDWVARNIVKWTRAVAAANP